MGKYSFGYHTEKNVKLKIIFYFNIGKTSPAVVAWSVKSTVFLLQ